MKGLIRQLGKQAYIEVKHGDMLMTFRRDHQNLITNISIIHQGEQATFSVGPLKLLSGEDKYRVQVVAPQSFKVTPSQHHEHQIEAELTKREAV